MKKIMMVGSALMLLSTSAFATKARLQALGEDKDGSYFISDYRNIYINPSELNSMSNSVVVEWGSSGNTLLAGDASLDPDDTPKAQGGVIHGLSNGMKLGVILGDETDVASLTRMLASNVYGGTTSTKFLKTADNVIDLFVAGQSSFNWGANLLYTSSKDESNGIKQNAYAARLGANQGAWNAHMLIALGAKAENTSTAKLPTYKGNFGARIGGGYDISTMNKVFGMYENYSWKQDNVTDPERTAKFSKGILGVGHTEKLSDSSTMFAKAQVEMVAIEVEAVSTLVAAKIDRLALPLSVGFEHTATDWLILRGSLVQNLYGTVKDSGLDENFSSAAAANTGYVLRNAANAKYGSSMSGSGKKTLANSTAVNAGATLAFGKVKIDGLVGTTSSTGTAANKGILSWRNLETRVGMTYNF
jgi:hypothetical protein